MRGKHLRILAIVAALAILAGACTDGGPAPPIDRSPSAAKVCRDDPFGCLKVEPGNPIRLAALLAVGEADPRGEARFATRLAVERHARVFGHRVALVIQGDDCSPVGVSVLDADPAIAGVIGWGCGSYWHRLAAEVLSERGIVFVSATSTGPELTHGKTHAPFFVRTTYNDAIQGHAMARFVRDRLGLMTSATIHDRSPYAESLTRRFAAELSEVGGRTVAQQALRVGRTDFRLQLARIRKEAPDFLYAPVFVAEGALLA